MDETWTISELVEEVERRIQALPAPKNGQVRAVPDDRTIRYYMAIGLVDRPAAMRGRTALYSRKHAAQIVAIKRFQTMERSLAEIQNVLPTLDEATLSRMSGIELPAASQARATRKNFWKAAPAGSKPAPTKIAPDAGHATNGASAVELRVELAPNISLSIAMSGDVAISLADVAAIRAAAAPMMAELAKRQLAAQPERAIEEERGDV